MNERKQVTPRVAEHVERLRMAGLDTARFFDALVQLRDDKALPEKHRRALIRLVAMESFTWYLEALRNERIDRMALRDTVIEMVKKDLAARAEAPPEPTQPASAKPRSKKPTARKKSKPR